MTIDFITVPRSGDTFMARCSLCRKPVELTDDEVFVNSQTKSSTKPHAFCCSYHSRLFHMWRRSAEGRSLADDYYFQLARYEAHKHHGETYKRVSQKLFGSYKKFDHPGDFTTFLREGIRMLHASGAEPTKYVPPKRDKRQDRYKKYRGKKRVLTPPSIKKRRLAKKTT